MQKYGAHHCNNLLKGKGTTIVCQSSAQLFFENTLNLFTSTISLSTLSKSFLPRASIEAPRDHTHEKRYMH